MLSDLKDFLKSRTFLYSLLVMFTVIGISLYLLYNWLGSYTHHGESITVPDVRGMSERATVIEETWIHWSASASSAEQSKSVAKKSFI